MKISRLALVLVSINGLILALLSKELYSLQREMQLRMVANSINKSLFRLEDDVRQVLSSNHHEELQAVLDRASAINNAIDTVSISRNGKNIDFSSSRSLQGKLIGNEYYPISKILHGLVMDNELEYKSDFYYFEGAEKRDVQMLVQINNEYVFGELDKAAFIYGVSIFLIFALLSAIIFVLVQKFLVNPLEKLTQHAHAKNEEHNVYFVDELTELDLTLTNSFKSMIVQQEALKESLEKTRYLDAILRTVADINQLLISVQDIDELMFKSVHHLAGHHGYGLCWIGLEEAGVIKLQAASSNEEIPDIVIEHTAADNPVLQAFFSNKSVIINHIENLESIDSWIKIAQKNLFGSFITLPLRSSIHEDSFGVLCLYTFNSEGFESKEVAMLEELAGDIGFAIDSFQKRQELEYHLTTDAITDLPNRIVLVDKLAEERNDATLAIINLDRFNDFNDVYGVAIGDSVLAVYANWLSSKIKSHKFMSLYKLSGDEYAVLFDKCVDVGKCKQFMNDLIFATSHEVFLVKEIEMTFSITVGIASGLERIIEHATAALKRAKISRQPLEIHSESSSRIEHENNISRYKNIKEAIDESRVVPFFQPIVDNNSGQIVKYEALVRIINKDGTVMSPVAFLDISKKTRLYGQLTKIMVDKTFAKLKESRVPISINLSTEDLLNVDLAEYIENLIQLHQIGQKVIFEILESEGIDNYNEVRVFVERFKVLGCRFAIDDFGAGYSNFDHLLKLNIDTLKIDASLIKNLSHDVNARLFVQHINDFSHKIGIETVAEFVANEAIYEEVKRIGIDYSQGYHFYEPSADLVSDKFSI
ncbi:GGDEF domain-containing protein [bacterium]|nr:GGDEF domain-containing protein [bacterium]